MKRQAAPIFAAILLLLPVLYVGSYLALVVPGGVHRGLLGSLDYYPNYRACSRQCDRIFWPMEQIDRKLRPGAWGGNFFPWEIGSRSSGKAFQRMEP